MKHRFFKTVFNTIWAQLPVIGPHVGIEAALMLSGKKPLTWLPVYPDDLDLDPASAAFREQEGRKKLDQAVREGRLLSADVTGEMPLSDGTTRTWISRHYCQPEYAHEMRLMVAFNSKVFNKQPPEVRLEKNIGLYLGYRKRDVWWWNNSAKVPRFLQSATVFVNVKIAQPALRECLLRNLPKK